MCVLAQNINNNNTPQTSVLIYCILHHQPQQEHALSPLYIYIYLCNNHHSMTTPTTRTVCLTYFIHVDLLLCREAVIDHRTTKFTNHP